MKTTLSVLLLSLLPLLTQSHSYWLELKGAGKVGEPMTVQCYFGELENGLREKGPVLNGIKAFTASVLLPDGTTEPLALMPAENCYQAQFTPKQAELQRCYKFTEQECHFADWSKMQKG
jgi:hypothetical protein